MTEDTAQMISNSYETIQRIYTVQIPLNYLQLIAENNGELIDCQFSSHSISFELFRRELWEGFKVETRIVTRGKISLEEIEMPKSIFDDLPRKSSIIRITDAKIRLVNGAAVGLIVGIAETLRF